ncbi:hypothetical protein CWS43_20755 [Rahnella sp. AA]|nr:hypothetical protein CWS43_20755 [Rahnella sp. AA]
MDKKFYFKNFFICLFYLGVAVTIFVSQTGATPFLFAYTIIISAMFPLARKALETLVLKVSSEEFWTTGFFQPSSAKNTLWVIYYAVIIVLVVPLSLIYVILYFSTKKAT